MLLGIAEILPALLLLIVLLLLVTGLFVTNLLGLHFGRHIIFLNMLSLVSLPAHRTPLGSTPPRFTSSTRSSPTVSLLSPLAHNQQVRLSRLSLWVTLVSL